ncbi:Hint domain-containing protein [Algicella marina]|uniref:Hedgehog/Intein (Hint) domain-containing protein n=1 Tax=Algicella marina TaxID=2683284 RepID=A0A6P1T4S9_9RHOB|nr:Hint domain-containing protein [Algicella marina]QHQ37017.1 hypothetical protein GO499_18425 [Algicella marina]
MPATFEFTLSGDGSQGYMNAYSDYEASVVTITILETLAGSGNPNYSAGGWGPDYAGDTVTDDFNFVVPEGWTVTESYISTVNGGQFDANVYDSYGTLVTTINVNGGDFGTVTNVCFTRGAMIATPEGERTVESLQEGDLVITRDRGVQPIRWIGSSKVTAETLAQFPDLRPVRLLPGALGDHDETLVSPAHRMLLSGWRAEALFGESEVLVSAKSLINDSTVRVADDLTEVEYFHVMFDTHEVIRADGAWSESFHPAALGMGTASETTRDEVLALFPELESDNGQMQRARMTLTSAEVLVCV